GLFSLGFPRLSRLSRCEEAQYGQSQHRCQPLTGLCRCPLAQPRKDLKRQNRSRRLVLEVSPDPVEPGFRLSVFFPAPFLEHLKKLLEELVVAYHLHRPLSVLIPHIPHVTFSLFFFFEMMMLC